MIRDPGRGGTLAKVRALPARVAIEEALHRGRCGIDADCRRGRRLDSRARRELASGCRRSGKKHEQDMRVNPRVCGAGVCL